MEIVPQNLYYVGNAAMLQCNCKSDVVVSVQSALRLT